jgi:hypothetical protein
MIGVRSNASTHPHAWTLALLPLLLASKCDNAPVDTDPDSDTQAPARLAFEVSPSVAGVGTSLEIDATRAAFVFGDTQAVFGEGISVTSVTVQDGFQAVARVDVDLDAPLGPRDLTVVIAGQEHVLEDAFTVIDQSFVIEPANGKMGETLYVDLLGFGTSWEPNFTWASFGRGVEVLDFRVIAPNLATARIAILPDAPPGPRDVEVQEGSQVVSLYEGFTVDRAVITAFFDPPEAYQGETKAFDITGLDTAFTQDTVIEFWDDGGPNADIQVVELNVIDVENVFGRIRVSNAAALGHRDVMITSGDESILLPDAIEVLDAPPDLSNVVPVIGYDVTRQIDNATGDLLQEVRAFAYFVIPLSPPCGAAGVPGSGPMPYDNNGVFPVPPPPQPVDCPYPETVSAGDFVWFEGPENIVTMPKQVIQSTGQIIYWNSDLSLDDYKFDTLYDLHTQGDPDGIPEVIVERVQPTVPADYYLTSPDLWGDYTHDRTTDFDYTWTPAQTYPEAIFSTQISGTLVVDGEPGFAGSIPWDDGAHRYTSGELSQLQAGPVTFSAASFIQGPIFALPFSIYQSRSDSTLSTTAELILE